MNNKEKHESGLLHVTGKAVYIDDMPELPGLLHGFVFTSSVASGRIFSFNIEKAKAVPGIEAILCYRDIPGENQMGPVIHDEPALAEETLECIGQAIFLIAATSENTGREALRLIEIEIEESPAILTIDDAISARNLLQPPRKIECGSVEKGLAEAENYLEGKFETGAQEHWYLETQVAMAIPGEGQEMKVFASTQHPSETQALVAEVLDIPKNQVEVEIRRMGGAFGGKETQANHVSVWAALLANATGKPVKLRLSRDEDQIMTGKRHPFLINYKVAFTGKGKIAALDVELNANAGYATDLSMAILERAMFHATNAYYIPNVRIVGKAWKTNQMSNTAFRGFGGPQGIAAIENIIDRISRKLGKDPAEIRYLNFFGMKERNITPYQQKVKNNRLHVLWEKLIHSSNYSERRKSINVFNAENEFLKRGLALSPVQFGISFTTSFLNQAGALVNIYKDGSVLVNHGGTEMGQGLHTKIRQIAALELGISIDQVKVTATNTSKVPNTSATAASSGSDLNGMAVKDAISKLKKRIGESIAKILSEKYGYSCNSEKLIFKNNFIWDQPFKERKISFNDAVLQAYFNQESLSATGFYKTPNIHFDKVKGIGHPFHYYAFGMAVSEVELDVLTGHHRILRTDILHDAGNSINEALDIGQIEGGFIQGVGWVTSEECKWDSKGNLLNHSPDTYKIPGINDIPEIFNVELLKGYPNPNTIRQSKAVGEPPFMLALSVWLAIKDAVSAVGDHKIEPDLNIPATHEKILMASEKIKQEIQQL
ncbi:MAG: xanthine dehydrogenase molybdopterin binding subunit [Bacteroidales bacterium]|nr:xanthine dehydrogenase molybdopterin binding subunit [Bacteroidales bacterium]MCF8455599.1 xanthine dehydrogenase molybdopterin binding subunit [Bacteroidales bacterium]